MNNEELKKKICKIIAPYVSAWGEDERIADALIAARIGDVKEAEHRAKVLGRTLAIMKGKGLISGVVDDYIVQAEKELAEGKRWKEKDLAQKFDSKYMTNATGIARIAAVNSILRICR